MTECCHIEGSPTSAEEVPMATTPTTTPTEAAIRPFLIAIPDAELNDLRARLARTRWPDEHPDVGWGQGVPLAYLRSLADRWRSFDWRAQEERLNGLPQFVTTIDGQTVHFIHVRSDQPDATPLLLLHGYPGSFVDYVDLVGVLTNPGANGVNPTDAFHVVIASLPGFGFSTPVVEPGWESGRTARALVELMRRLGYARYAAHGYDIGAGVAGELGQYAPDAVLGAHVATDPGAIAYLGMLPDPTEETEPAERATIERLRAEADDRTGYLRLQSTRPQTIAYGLTDSPALQLAWIVEKFKEWTDPIYELPEEAVDLDAILTTVSIYWFTGSGASAARFIWEAAHAERDWGATNPAPTGFAVFNADPIVRRTLDPGHAIAHWSEFERGGHFPALEVPELLVPDIRSFFRGLSGG
jgi:pimeloyl-ACP methyl ester carboxylesterase